MKPDLDSLIAKARAPQQTAALLDDAFNQHVWRRIRMSEDIRRQERWSLGLLLSNPVLGVGCMLLAVSVGVGFGLLEGKLRINARVVQSDLSVFSSEPPSLPSSLLHHP